MYTTQQLNGSHLPKKTLCLTYDDGPGEHTLAIARFLYEQQIRATFFVVGKYAVHHTDVLAALNSMGHIIGNHTYEHPDIPYYVSVNGDVQNQILRTDAIIKTYTSNPIFFRTPYGKWSAEVANELNSNLLCSINHIGPVHWEIPGIDCYYWQQGKSIEEAVTSYLTTIDEVGSGIVVMHDEIADMDVVKSKNQTLELTKRLIPVLKSKGYRFVGLDEVITPGTQNSSSILKLQADNKKYISLQANTTLLALGSWKKKNTELTIEDVGEGVVTLKALNGCYLSLKGESEIKADQKETSSYTQFHLIPIHDNKLVLRTFNGNFLVIDKNTKQVTASAKYMRQATIFSFHPLNTEIKKKVTLQMKYQLWKKRLAFVKSKLLSK